MKKFILLVSILALSLGLFNMAFADTVQIGDGTGTSTYFPFYGWYGYNYTQQICPQAEINQAGLISKIRFYYISGDIANCKDLVVYMGHTDKTAFDSNTDWEPVANLTQVFAGDVSSMLPEANNWMEITLTTPFDYNNVDNLIIAIDENTPGYVMMSWGGFTSGANTGIYYYSDGTNPDPTAPLAANGTTNQVARIQLAFPSTTAPLAPTLLAPANGSTSFANGILSWQQTGTADATNYDVYFGTSETPPLVSSAQIATSYTPTLTVGETYYWNVVAGNAIGDSPASDTWSFTVVPGVIIGDGTQTQRFPLGSFYGFERSAALYLASEIGPQNSSISAISWYASAAYSITVPTKIYLKTSTENTLTNAPWADMISGATLLYDQERVGLAVNDWNEFTLNDNFNVDEGQNLMVLVERNYGGGGGGGGSTGAAIYSTSMPNTHLTWQRDSTPPDANGTTASIRPNVKIAYTAFTYDTPPAPANVVSPANGATYVVGNSTLNWSPAGGAVTEGYKLFFGTDNPPTNIENNTEMGNFTTYNPNGLDFSTTYYWQVVPYNTYGSTTGAPIWSFTSGGAPLRGEKTIDPAGSGADNFVSFAEAITALNGAGVGQDGVVFNVPAGLTFNEASAIPAINVTGTLENPITFVKSGTGDNPVVTIPGTTGASDYVFKLNGVDYVTFDGIDVSNATGMTNLEYGYWLVDTPLNGGSSYNVIKNSTISLDRVNILSIGVRSFAVASQNNNNLFQNITVNNAYHGLYLEGMQYLSDEYNVVQGCTLNDIAKYNIGLDYQSFMDIFDNQVNFPVGDENFTNSINGIYSYELANSSIYNNTLSGGNTSKSMTCMMIHMCSEVEIHHNTISGIVTTNTWWQGISFSPYTAGVTNVHHNDIYDIDAGMLAWPMNGTSSYGVNINDNNIHDIKASTSIWGMHIIQSASLDAPANIFNNKVYNLELTGQLIQLVSGINVQDRYANIYNNMVWNITAPNSNYVPYDGPQLAGISIKDMQAGEGERGYFYNNSVLLDGSGTDNYTSAAFYCQIPGPMDMKNNIFINNSTPGANGRSVAFWKHDATFDNFVATMDNNIYYAGTPGPRNLIYHDSTQSAQTLAEYKALNAGKDQNSYTENVPFVSATAPYDLHIDPTVPTYVEGNGIPLPTVLIDDIDGDIRDATTPDIGADEGDFTVYVGGVTLNAPANVSIVLAGADIEISWDAVDGATGYYVYGSDLPYADSPWGTPVMTVNAPDTTTTLSPSSQFKFYYVTAFE